MIIFRNGLLQVAPGGSPATCTLLQERDPVRHIAYIGTYTTAGSEGIYRIEFAEGNIQLFGTIPAVNPSYLVTGGDTLYAVRETRGGSALSYRMTANGIHELTGQQETMGDAPCHLCLDGGYLYAANYSTGSLAEFTLDDGGRVQRLSRLIEHTGSSVHPTRQTKPHVHFSCVTPDGKYLAVCDLGTDEVLFYRRTDSGIEDAPESVHVPQGSGPRHAVFGKKEVWYVVCELTCTLLVYRGYGKDAELVQNLSMLQTPDPGSSCAALQMSPDSQSLLVSVRGANSLVLAGIREDGLLENARFHSSCGDWPRDARFTPCGRYVICACERSGHLSVFGLVNDMLEHMGNYPLPSPTCICFVSQQ